MATNQGQYWKNYYDFKRNNYDSMINATIQFYSSSTWTDRGDIPIYFNIDRVKASNDPFISKGAVYGSFSFALADWNLALTETPKKSLGSCTASDDGSGKLKITKTAHGLNNAMYVNFTATTFPTGLSLNTVYGVEVIDDNSFYPLLLLNSSKINYSTTGSAVIVISRNLPYLYYSPTREQDFKLINSTIKDSTAQLITGATTSFNYFNIKVASSRYVNFVDFAVDNINCIVNVRGQYLNKATAT